MAETATTATAATETAAPVKTATETAATTTTTAEATTAATATETAAGTAATTTAATGTAAAAATSTAAATTAAATETAATGDFPADWREKAAAGDEKKLGMLKRYASPAAVADALANARDLIAKGQKREPLAADATPEQIAEYRKANNVPEAPDKYDTTLKDGLVIGEADKPMLDGYLKYAHTNHLPNEVVKANLGWYFEEQNRLREAQFEKDATTKQEVVIGLRDEYGPDYKRQVRAADDLLDSVSPDFKVALMTARMQDGTLVGANPTAVRFLINTALQVNPFATVTPAAGGGAQATAETELANLKVEMRDDKGPYWKGPLAAGKQARFRELTEMFDKAARK